MIKTFNKNSNYVINDRIYWFSWLCTFTLLISCTILMYITFFTAFNSYNYRVIVDINYYGEAIYEAIALIFLGMMSIPFFIGWVERMRFLNENRR